MLSLTDERCKADVTLLCMGRRHYDMHTECHRLNNEYESARKSAREWELDFCEKCIKDEQYLIMGILAYLENVAGGF